MGFLPLCFCSCSPTSPAHSPSPAYSPTSPAYRSRPRSLFCMILYCLSWGSYHCASAHVALHHQRILQLVRPTHQQARHTGSALVVCFVLSIMGFLPLCFCSCSPVSPAYSPTSPAYSPTSPAYRFSPHSLFCMILYCLSWCSHHCASAHVALHHQRILQRVRPTHQQAQLTGQCSRLSASF